MKIITYNLGLLDVFIFGKKIFEFAPHTRSRAIVIAKTLAKLEADVICFQEVFHAPDRDRILDSLKHIYPYSAYPDIKKSKLNKRLSSGLLTISKHPFTKIKYSSSKSQMLDELLIAPKGYLLAELFIDDATIQIINIHTTGGGLFSHPESERSDKVRLSQLKEVLGLSDKNTATVLCGDLNCGPDVSEDIFCEITSQLQSDYQIPKDFRATWDPSNPLNENCPHSTSPPQFIDHIIPNDVFLSKYAILENGLDPISMDFIENKEYTVSDHYAFYAKYAVK